MKSDYQTLLEDEETEDEETIPLEEELLQERDSSEEPVQNDVPMKELAQTIKIEKRKDSGAR